MSRGHRHEQRNGTLAPRFHGDGRRWCGIARAFGRRYRRHTHLIRSHWENNYGGSVKALAVVKKRLAEALGDKDLPPYVYNDL